MLVLGAWLAPQWAHAQASSELDVATARELGYHALLALERHDYAAAESGLDRALSLRRAPTLLLARGQAKVGLGKLVSAVADFSAAAGFPDEAGESRAFQAARIDARRELEELEPKVPHLTVLAAPTVRRVLVNDIEWASSTLGVARPVDPGAYTVQVFGEAGAVRSYQVTLVPAQAMIVEVRPPQPEHEAGAAPVRRLSLPVEIPHPPPTPPPAAKHASASGPSGAAYVLGAVSLGLIGSAVATGLVAMNKKRAFDRENLPEVALEHKQSLRRDASTWAWLNAGLWAGAAAASGLTAYVIFSATPETAADRTGLRLQLSANGRF